MRRRPRATRAFVSRGVPSVLDRVDTAIGGMVEALAGVLVAVETAILFAGVVSRYVFREPLTWSDELASILFLWLAMLGAVVAYRRGEHMRMAALIDQSVACAVAPSSRRSRLPSASSSSASSSSRRSSTRSTKPMS